MALNKWIKTPPTMITHNHQKPRSRPGSVSYDILKRGRDSRIISCKDNDNHIQEDIIVPLLAYRNKSITKMTSIEITKQTGKVQIILKEHIK